MTDANTKSMTSSDLEALKQSSSTDNSNSKPPSLFWRIINIFFNQVFNPVVFGIFYGAGYILGTAVIRRYVLSRIGLFEPRKLM